MPDNKSLKSRTVSSLFWKLLERGGSQAVTLIVQIVLARILEPTDFGTLAIVLVFVNIGAVFVQSGMNTALVQAAEADAEDYTTVFYMCLAISIILYVVVFLTAPLIEAFYQIEGLVDILRVMALLLPIGALNSVQVAIITRDLRLKNLFIATLSASLVSGAIGIGMALSGFGLWALVAQQLTASIVSCVVMRPLCGWTPRLVFSKDKAARHFGFGWKLLASKLLHAAYSNLYDLIIGKVFSSGDLGFFNQGKKIPSALESLFDSAISSVMLSSAAKLQNEKEKLRALTRRAMQLTTYVVASLMLLLAVTAEPIVSLVFTDKWLPCVPFLQVYAIVFSLTPINTSNLQTINAMGRSDVVLKLEVVKKTIAISMLLFTSLVIGNMMAIAIGNLIYALIAVAINMGPLKSLLDYGRMQQLRDIAPSFAVAFAAGIAAYLVGIVISDCLLRIIGQTLVFVLAVIVLSIVFKLGSFQYLKSLYGELLGSVVPTRN